ncbi:MAG: hypothetical protein J5849_03215 [Clostridia bacterium]|nr:hypothetical protein [Clostridia bacterium]MBR5742665.1 hypothetical protein [Clostridia bacterium]
MPEILCPAREIKIGEEECRKDQIGGAEACLLCARYYKNLPTFHLAEKLLAAEGMTGKLEYHVEGDYFSWTFHDALSLTVTTGRYGFGYIEVNESFPMKPYAEEMFDVLAAIGRGETVFVTKIGLAGRYIEGVYPLEVYRAKRKKLRFGIGVRVYTAKGEIE